MTVKKRLLKPTTVFRMWNAIPEAERNAKLAKQYAKKCGMKSMGEVRCAADLIKRKIPYGYETHTMEYQYKPQQYTPDFELYVPGDRIYIEYKGKMTNEVRRKMLAIKDCNPDIEVCLVFEKPKNKIRKGSKTTYAQWAEKNGFKWSEHYVKEEWLKGALNDKQL
jgi:hypothetical protein